MAEGLQWLERAVAVKGASLFEADSRGRNPTIPTDPRLDSGWATDLGQAER
jgi:hypothetical protein